MSIFSRDEDKEDSCGFHHWEIYDRTNRYKIEPAGSYLTEKHGFDIFNKVKKQCQHEGCNAKRESWVRVNNISGHIGISKAQELIDELCNL